MNNVLFLLFILSVILGMGFAMLMLIGSSVYDLFEVLSEKNYKKLSRNTAIKRYRPLVSIIIPVFNESAVIERCLNNLLDLKYRKFEIIIADDKSTDQTKVIVNDYIKRHPGAPIKLVRKKKNGGRGAAINLGVKHAVGEIVMAYDADCLLERDALHRLVKHFADKSASAVAANVRILYDGSVLGLLQQLEYLVSFRSKKFNTVTNSEVIIGGAGASYRRSVLLACGGFDERMKTEDIEFSMRLTNKLGKRGGLKYASDYVVFTEPVPTYRALFRQRFRWKFGSLQALYHNKSLLFSRSKDQNIFTSWVRLPYSLWCELMIFLEPLYFILFVIIAIKTQNATLFVSASAVFSVIALLAIWSDEHFSLKERMRLSCIAPFIYVASFIMTAVQIVAALRCVKHIKGIIGLRAESGSYITTQRVKRDIVSLV